MSTQPQALQSGPLQVLSQWLSKSASSPLTVLGSALLGILAGTLIPQYVLPLEIVNKLYITLLTMIVLPLLVTSILLSLQKAIRESSSSALVRRIALSFIALSLFTGAVTAVISSVATQIMPLEPQQRLEMGKMVAGKSTALISEVNYAGDPPRVQSFSETTLEVVDSVVPSNVFEALSEGAVLKVLVFSLIFGVALAQLPSRTADALNDTVEAINRACFVLTRWVCQFIPIVIFCVSSSQLAKAGWGTFKAMGVFVGMLTVASLLLFMLFVLILMWRSGKGAGDVFRSMKDSLSLVAATSNVAVCLQMMMDGLAKGLGFSQSRVEFSTPLAMTLMRAGVIIYFVCAILFVYEIEERTITLAELLAVVMATTLVAFGTGGMAGIVTVSMLGTVCQLLELPFDAIFVLLVAVDAIGSVIRSVLNVAGIYTAVALICPRPLKL